jgi:hypothetical protein
MARTIVLLAGLMGPPIASQEVDTLEGHAGSVLSPAFRPDGKFLASGGGGKDASIKRWDLRGPNFVEKTERFDRDPGWDGRNHRPTGHRPRTIRQDFGYSATGNAGRAAGEIGGFVTPAAESAFYAKVLPAATLNEPLSASGTLFVGQGGTLDDGAGNTLVGFFNADSLNEWRTPNSIVLRVNGRGDGFHLHLEYATARWRAGGDFFAVVDAASGKRQMRLIPSRKVHTWSLKYDPRGNNGGGTITATLNEETLVLNLDPGHKADGATFNRFGLLNVMKSADTGGWLWLDDLTVNGVTDRFDADPKWEGRDNRRTHDTFNVRPWFDFGYSPTRYAGGQGAGEMGGLIFRGDERYPDRMAYYGDRVGPFDLDRPLRASGRICLRRGVTDSTVLVGFFHSTESLRQSDAQKSGIPENFLGAAIEGPSRDGFFFYPVYGVDREGQGGSAPSDAGPPHILPDGKPHDWSLDYSPAAGGRITVRLDGKSVSLDLSPDLRAVGARFDRFGIVTTHIDGNGQLVYLDDLTYSFK